MMWLTTMNPETRRLIQVTPAGCGGHRAGCSTCCWAIICRARKDYIAENGSMYLELADIS